LFGQMADAGDGGRALRHRDHAAGLPMTHPWARPLSPCAWASATAAPPCSRGSGRRQPRRSLRACGSHHGKRRCWP
jgi:hypothetical protein